VKARRSRSASTRTIALRDERIVGSLEQSEGEGENDDEKSTREGGPEAMAHRDKSKSNATLMIRQLTFKKCEIFTQRKM